MPIRVKGVDHALYLIVAHTGRKQPLLLVTDCRPASPKEAGDLIQAYLERWGSEEVTRACKQPFQGHFPLNFDNNCAVDTWGLSTC